MIDKRKRQTLKRMSAAGAATAASFSGIAVSAQSLPGLAERGVHSGGSATAVDDSSLGGFRLHTRVSTVTNDLEVVLTNTGDHPATITQMTPYETVTQRGRFVFGDLFDANGTLTLEAGQSVTVPMQRDPFTPKMTAGRTGAGSLADTLRRGVSIVVEGKSFAPVDVVAYAPFA